MKHFFLTSVFMVYNLIAFAGPRLDREDYHHGSSGGGVAIIAVIIIGLILLFGGRKR